MYIGSKNYHSKNPNICPHCHVVNNPEPIWDAGTTDTEDVDSNISIWQCANSECKKLFIALYQLVEGKPVLIRFLNGYPKGPDWPQPIWDLRNGNREDIEQSRFIRTYLQSLEAENYGLDEIAGMGFRKSIEYLVKDWAIKSNQEEKEKIRELWLGQVIKNYYKGDLKDILERATWLGNDQAHYNRLFEEFDIDILKELIALIMVELDRQHKMNHYIEAIQSRK